MKVFELTPTNGRKSFNGNAKVIEENGLNKLLSYNTIVAEYNPITREISVKGWFSSTTATHINAFLNHYGFSTRTKAEMLTNPL